MVWAAAGNLPEQNKNNECVNRPPETAVKKYASTYDLPCTEKLDGNFYILPSSVHEILLLLDRFAPEISFKKECFRMSMQIR